MRKIETINKLQSLGLRVAEVREFKAVELKEMLGYANDLINRFGVFNLRTDSDSRNFNLPFIRHCSISKLLETVKEFGDKITYLVHQDIPVENQLFNGVLRLCDDLVIGEINDVDKTSLRQAMKVPEHLKQVCEPGNNFIFKRIKDDLLKARADAWFELSAYNDGSVVYWQIIPESISDHLKNQFIKLDKR